MRARGTLGAVSSWELKVQNNKIYGRGTADNKANTVNMVR